MTLPGEKRGRIVAVKEILDVSRVFADGKVQIPSDVRKLLEIKPGDDVVWLRDPQGEAVLLIKKEKVTLQP